MSSSSHSDPPTQKVSRWDLSRFTRLVPEQGVVILLAMIVGVLAGYGSILFTLLIEGVNHLTIQVFLALTQTSVWGYIGLAATPAIGLVLVSWFTRRYAPEAQGHGVPEVIKAVARNDGIIRPQVSIIKILASGICIGMGGSVGREGPIVQIGSSLGSTAAQWFNLPSRHIRVLAAAGAAAGISATFSAPLAGVVFASEIILGSFAVESLTAIVIAAVLADVVQQNQGEHGFDPAFLGIEHRFDGAWHELPSYLILGFICGLVAVGFTKFLYWTEDQAEWRLPNPMTRAIVCGLLVGILGTAMFALRPVPPIVSPAVAQRHAEHPPQPMLFGVGYEAVSHSLHLENARSQDEPLAESSPTAKASEMVRLTTQGMLAHLWWLIPLIVLKPILTSATLAGGGSGGIFAPSLFIGATVGAAVGLIFNLLVPGLCDHPGAFALVGMGAVVAGTTHGVLSAILIVYELTDDYRIILPIMAAAGISSLVARWIDPESIYEKKLSRRGESITRGHDLHHMENIKVRDVMIRQFPTVRQGDNLVRIIEIARANPQLESLPVMDPDGNFQGIIRPEDLHRILDTDANPYLVNADDIALVTPMEVSPDQNLLEVLRDFGSRDIDTLPVVVKLVGAPKLIGLVARADVMRRYRQELLNRH